MLKLTTAYFLGAMTVATIVAFSGGRAAAVSFFVGLLLPVLAAALALGSRPRLYRAARFLDALRAALSRPGAQLSAPEPARAPQLCGEVESALRNLGLSKPQAKAAAGRAATENPGADFETVLRAALQSRKAAA